MPSLHLPLLLTTLLALLLTNAVTGHNIQMGAHTKECFHEVLHKDDRMTVTFQVGDREFGGAGNLEIDFWVSVMRWGKGMGGMGMEMRWGGEMGMAKGWRCMCMANACLFSQLYLLLLQSPDSLPFHPLTHQQPS